MQTITAMKNLKIKRTTLFDEEKATVISMNKKTACQLIADLTEELAREGTVKAIFRDGDQLFLFRVVDEQ